MEMKEIVALIFGIVLGVGVLVSISNDLLNTQQPAKANLEVNTAVTSFNQTITLAQRNLVAGSVTVINATCIDTCSGSPNSTLRLNSEYTVNLPAGNIKFSNRTGQFNISYNYYPHSYVGGGIPKTIYDGMLPLIAVGILVYLAKLAFKGD